MASRILRRHLVAVAMLLGLPALTWYVWICLRYFDGALVVPASPADVLDLLSAVPAPTWPAVLLYAAWIFVQIGLHVALPAQRREGTPLHNGPPLTYRINGWASFWCTWVVVLAAVSLGVVSPTAGYDLFGPLLTTANISAFALALYLYALGKGGGPH